MRQVSMSGPSGDSDSPGSPPCPQLSMPKPNSDGRTAGPGDTGLHSPGLALLSSLCTF